MVEPSTFSPKAGPPGPAVKRSSTPKCKTPAGVATTVLEQLRASARRQSAPLATPGRANTTGGTKVGSRGAPAPAPAPGSASLDRVEMSSLKDGARRAPGSRQSAVVTPSSHVRNNHSLRDPYHIPSDSEADDLRVWSSASKHSAPRRVQQQRTPSVLTARHANNQEMPTTPTVSSGAGASSGPGPASARRSRLRTPSKVPTDAKIISLRSSSPSNETRSPLARAAHTPTTPHPRTAKQVPEDAKIISLSDSSNNEASAALESSPYSFVTKATKRHPPQPPIENSRKLGNKKATGSREPLHSPAVKIERKPWWSPWDWARRYGDTEFEVNGPDVWFSDGPFKGYVISGPREGSYMPGYHAPSNEVLAQAEKTAFPAETTDLWESSSEASEAEGTEQYEPTTDTTKTTEESDPGEQNPVSCSPAALSNPCNNSEYSTELSPQTTERRERMQRTQQYVFTGNPNEGISRSTDTDSLEWNRDSMLPGNLAPASTPKRGSSLPSTNSESTSVLIAQQLNVHSSPPPSNQELAVLMSSSPAPRPIREEQSSDEDDDSNQGSAELGADVSAHLPQIIKPTRSEEVRCDIPRRLERLGATCRESIAEKRMTRSMTVPAGSPKPPDDRTSDAKINTAVKFGELPGGATFRPARETPRLKRSSPHPKGEVDAHPKADIIVEIPAMPAKQQAIYATVPSSQTSLDAVCIPKSFDELNGTCTSRSTQPFDSNEEALAFTLRESPSWLNSITQIDSTPTRQLYSTRAVGRGLNRLSKSRNAALKYTGSPQVKSPSLEPSDLDTAQRDEGKLRGSYENAECTIKTEPTAEPKGVKAETSDADSTPSKSLRTPEKGKERKSGTSKLTDGDGSTADAYPHHHHALGPAPPRPQPRPRPRPTTAVPLPPLFVAYTYGKTGYLPKTSASASASQPTPRSPVSLTNPDPELADTTSHPASSAKKRRLDELEVEVEVEVEAGGSKSPPKKRRKGHGREYRGARNLDGDGDGGGLLGTADKGHAEMGSGAQRQQTYAAGERSTSTTPKPTTKTTAASSPPAKKPHRHRHRHPPIPPPPPPPPHPPPATLHHNPRKREGKKKRHRYRGRGVNGGGSSTTTTTTTTTASPRPATPEFWGLDLDT